MCVSIEGPPLDSFDFEKAANMWGVSVWDHHHHHHHEDLHAYLLTVNCNYALVPVVSLCVMSQHCLFRIRTCTCIYLHGNIVMSLILGIRIRSESLARVMKKHNARIHYRKYTEIPTRDTVTARLS